MSTQRFPPVESLHWCAVSNTRQPTCPDPPARWLPSAKNLTLSLARARALSLFAAGGGIGGMAHPPGARFDPFGPPGVGGMGGFGPQGFPGMGRPGRPREFPENDIFRPPGSGDDMFM